MKLIRDTDKAPLTETRANYFDTLTPFKINKPEESVAPSREYPPLEGATLSSGTFKRISSSSKI